MVLTPSLEVDIWMLSVTNIKHMLFASRTHTYKSTKILNTTIMHFRINLKRVWVFTLSIIITDMLIIAHFFHMWVYSDVNTELV